MNGGLPPETQKGQPGIVQAALFGVCPNCGARTLFEAPAMIAGECSVCREPLAQLEGKGRAVGFITMALAVVLIFAAVGFDEMVRPPIWLHVLLWTPITIGSVLFTLRFYKTASVYRAFDTKRTALACEEPFSKEPLSTEPLSKEPLSKESPNDA